MWSKRNSKKSTTRIQILKLCLLFLLLHRKTRRNWKYANMARKTRWIWFKRNFLVWI